ncbi:MAG TPA: 6-bladed beta-propeller [Solirubrobacteraceae bacterium]|jgi:DNA-binding beta-propeller fold protein YncE|nr:6-bladed beta-propeller [Solirubrobacteraceae bacterium]
MGPIPTRSRSGRLLHAAVALIVLAWALSTGTSLASAAPCPGAGTCPYVAAQVIGNRAQGVLRFPEAVAVDAQGDVYVADQLGYVVQKFSASGVLETEWGSFGAAHGQFGPIGGIATDAAGDVYVVDSSHNRIEKFDANGNFLTSWGHHGSELGAFSFGSSQNYTEPPGGGIAVAGNYVYVADSGNNRIERFDLTGGEAMAWGEKGNGLGQFSYPRGVAANESEVIVSDDDNHRVQKFAPEGAFQSAAGSYGTGPGQFGYPYGVALDAAGNVYVADDINHRLVKLSPTLGFLGAWGGYGSKPGQLAFPRALAADPAGDTYVADTANDRVEVFNPEGAYLRTIGISARGPGELTAPRGLAVDPTGRLLVSDTVGNRIELFAPGTDSYLGQWTAAGGHASGFNMPAGIAVDPRGAVYLADVGNARLTHMWGDGTFLGEVGGPGDLGGAQLSGAESVAVADGPDETYVADAAHNRVLVYGPEGSLRAKWGAGGGNGSAGHGSGEFSHPSAVAVDGAGNAYVADTYNNRIVKLSPTGVVLTEWGSRGTGDERFHSPTGVAVDAAGNVYVVDSENNRVEVFDPEGHYLYQWGVRGLGIGEFSQPTAVAVECNGDVYVADTNNNRVERFNLSAANGSGCLAPNAWPPPLDVAPVLNVTLPRASGILARRALALTVSCQRGCKILASGTLTPIGRPSVSLVAAARGLPPARGGHVRLLVSPAGLRRLRRELGSGRALRASVTIVAAGPTGRRTTIAKTYIVAR